MKLMRVNEIITVDDLKQVVPNCVHGNCTCICTINTQREKHYYDITNTIANKN